MWKPTDATVVLEPELEYEGADLSQVASTPGPAWEPVCQLRDPAIFEEYNTTYLLYTVAGEQGIAVASIEDEWKFPD
jgi:hypothetical protein